MKWVADRTGRFTQRPHYTPHELDVECEKVISTFLQQRYGSASFPVSTDDLTRLVEKKADFDSFADLTGEGEDVEGVTEFRTGRRPMVRISNALAEASNRENRLRTTLTHEYAHVHFHHFLFDGAAGTAQLFETPVASSINRCHRHSIENAPMTDWLEWQAGYCCGSLLMPLTALHAEVRKFCSNRGVAYSGIGSLSEEGRSLIARISEAFQVSADAARVRLVKTSIIVDGVKSGTRDFLT